MFSQVWICGFKKKKVGTLELERGKDGWMGGDRERAQTTKSEKMERPDVIF